MTRAHEPVMTGLLQQIVDGEYAAGAWLPGEVQMADEHGVSRNTVREAVEALRKRGIVEVRHGRGQRVRAEEEWDLLDAQVLAAVISARRLDFVHEVVECQAMLEPAAAALAAQRASEEAVAELARLHGAVVRAAGGRRGVALDDPLVGAEIAFHRALGRMTGNRPLERMLAPVGTALALARHELARGEEEALVRALRRTLRAIEARDAEAARKSVAARVGAARRWLKRAG